MDPLQLIEQLYPPRALSHRLIGTRAHEVAESAEAVAVCAGREQSVDRPCGKPPR